MSPSPPLPGPGGQAGLPGFQPPLLTAQVTLASRCLTQPQALSWEMGQPRCPPWSAVRVQGGADRAGDGAPPPRCPHGSCAPGLRRWCQSAGSAGLAADLQSTQAVKAARLPGGWRAGGAPELLACCCPPLLPSPLLSAPVCELINLSPVGKLERRSHGLLRLAAPVRLPGHARPRCGQGHRRGGGGRMGPAGR